MTNKLGSCVSRCALALLVGLSLATAASGQTAWGYGGGYYPYSYYPYLPPIPLRANQPIPYHAVHPPVYYSHIVPRPYGYSPYAYVPGVATPEFVLRGPWRQPGHLRGHDFGRKWLGPLPGADREEVNRPNRQAASEAPSPTPVVIQNHYASGESATTAERHSATSAPLRIANPYCTGTGPAGSGVLETMGDDPRGRPQIVFPVAAAGAP